MALLKKVNPSWSPSEKPSLQVDEVIDFPGPYEKLVRSGMAVLVDADENEVELPGQEFECPICFEQVRGLKNFVDHVATHRPKEEPKEEPKKKEAKTEVKAEVVEKPAPAKAEEPKKESKKERKG